ncbi:U6 snRNA-associated Sm-like protein LSm8 [Skeletonema marinoi]|uniref:U6 snRNA-associated Sm-like protein LSm8 n=1 Tax=Skeletonema marinoi TaxID=267567 RepID=A0AAD9DC54_9STRA|nr:U6 snRNA-associated Sm-like protein LSm8 [Skeletonema marinoi]
MASTLSELTNKSITLLTCDGRLITGTLLGYDQLQNLILKQSYEKVYSMEAPVEKVELGLFVVRGDNVAVISEVTTADDGKDEDVRAEPIPPINATFAQLDVLQILLGYLRLEGFHAFPKRKGKTSKWRNKGSDIDN